MSDTCLSFPLPARRPVAATACGRPLRVVVVGGGIAGIGSALALAEGGASVDLFEAAPALGGACRGVEVEPGGPGRTPVTVDAGVSDFNRATFARLAALLGDLALPLQPVCQDASFRTPSGRWLWSSGEAGVAAAPGLDTAFAGELARFRALAPQALESRRAGGADTRLADWLRVHGFSDAFRRLVVEPRALGCFPSPDVDPGQVPMHSLVRFWRMHGLVGPGPADRVCVRGGMHRYLPAIEARLRTAGVRLHLGRPLHRIDRDPQGGPVVHPADATQGPLAADRLVLAVDPARALSLLAAPTAAERAVLGACRTQPARIVVHRDPRLMPDDPARWAAYNYVVPGRSRVPGPTITFFPQRLSRLSAPMRPVFVTLNPAIEPHDIVDDRVVAHPMFGRDDALATGLQALQGDHATWFCGAWTAEPYLHEQGLVSGLDAAADILARGAAPAWREAA